MNSEGWKHIIFFLFNVSINVLASLFRPDNFLGQRPFHKTSKTNHFNSKKYRPSEKLIKNHRLHKHHREIPFSLLTTHKKSNRNEPKKKMLVCFNNYFRVNDVASILIIFFCAWPLITLCIY